MNFFHRGKRKGIWKSQLPQVATQLPLKEQPANFLRKTQIIQIPIVAPIVIQTSQLALIIVCNLSLLKASRLGVEWHALTRLICRVWGASLAILICSLAPALPPANLFQPLSLIEIS